MISEKKICLVQEKIKKLAQESLELRGGYSIKELRQGKLKNSTSSYPKGYRG